MEERRKIFGPYPHGQRWRVFVGFVGGGRVARSYGTREEAEAAAKAARQKLGAEGPRLLADALDAYEVSLREAGNKPKSIDDTVYRLEKFFGGRRGTLAAITPARCAAAYKRLVDTMAVDSHRNILAQTRTFAAWLVGKKWLRADPLVDVKGTGARRKGEDSKPQLRIDEARKWRRRAHELADQGEDGAVAALLTLIMGMRSSEVVGLTARDVDDNGALLWVGERDRKTDAARRRLKVPDELRGHLRELADGKLPLAPLLGFHWRDWPRKWVQRICREAGVPEVCAHAMRGLHATLATAAGTSSEDVTRSLGHTSISMTRSAYATAESVSEAEQAAVVAELEEEAPVVTASGKTVTNGSTRVEAVEIVELIGIEPTAS